MKRAKKANLKIIKRSKKNSKNNISIKKVMEEVVDKVKPNKNDLIWLIYLTIPYKNKLDFTKAKENY